MIDYKVRIESPGSAILTEEPVPQPTIMKRFYVDHISGMTSDAEFVKIRDKLLEEGLIDPEEGREYRRVRRRDGRVTEQAFLHLWTKREEAEAFLNHLCNGDSSPRWKLFEVEVEGSIDEILDLQNLPLPGSPKVISITHEPYLDSLGEEAIQVWITIEDKPQGGLYEWSEVAEIHQTVHDTLKAEEINLYPYVHFLTVSEAAEQPQDA
jgi:hypothetical protein